jgi:hypothetical protein
LAQAQVTPNPPVELTVDGGTTVDPGTGSPGNPRFFDDFDYIVGRLDSGEAKTAAFTAAGWSGIKDETTQPRRASGYIYTVTSIPGYSGQMPGLSGSGRVLALEGLPTTMGIPSYGGNQTDFYLAYGTAAGPQTNVPGNVWFQFWVYINDYGSQQSHWSNRNKWIYPNDDGQASGDGTENAYLISLRPSSQAGTAQPRGARSYVVNKIESGSGGTVVSNSPEGATYIGANLAPNDGYIQPGRWELYKIHVDHASVNGRYEVWRRPMGSQSWQKTTEWISGTTPGFTWITQPGLRAGHNMFKIPTTWGTAQTADTTNYDCWVYMADFAMATREADLPTYGSY